jgi:PAS domain S-box-containing protein
MIKTPRARQESIHQESIILDLFSKRSQRKPSKKQTKIAQISLNDDSARTIMDSALDGIILVDCQNHVAYMNPAAERLFGYPQRKPTADPFLVTFHLEKFSKFFPDAETLLGNSSVYYGKIFETYGIKRDGTRFPVELSYAKLQLKNDSYGIAIMRDTTQRKQLLKSLENYSNHLQYLVDLRTQELKETNEKLLKAERMAAIGELAGMIGHDLRNPLTGMKGAAYCLKTKYSRQVGNNGQKLIEIIEECIQRSDKIICDLLDYAKELRIEPKETTPQQLLQKTFLLIKIPDTIKIVNQAQNEAINLDVDKMIRLLTNIIKNSIDAMPNGGTITIKTQKTQKNITFQISDTGIGIPKNDLSNLWKPLFTTKPKGMGFGLPICKRIAEAHKGTIAIESEINKGTKLTIQIPNNLTAEA